MSGLLRLRPQAAHPESLSLLWGVLSILAKYKGSIRPDAGMGGDVAGAPAALKNLLLAHDAGIPGAGGEGAWAVAAGGGRGGPLNPPIEFAVQQVVPQSESSTQRVCPLALRTLCCGR